MSRSASVEGTRSPAALTDAGFTMHPMTVTDPEQDDLVELIRASVIGEDEAVAGPFGIRRVTYADYTASGRALAFIEDYLRDAVLPLYANTHTESSGTGLQTTRFREEARRIIRDAVGELGRPRGHLLWVGHDGGRQQARGCAQPADPERPRRPLRPALAHPRPTSDHSSSSARTSTTATSCRGASRSATS